ncbi:hypothetical protein SXIM_14940 [Streptomyces xiamenensis]|uniref:Uncharacterized protein n=1 Tax=Streptomyces xiamenensis TaxID=408015 RepID=A0A0F7FT64_9ACTN|nr:hypothetical protein SXIM_14940 [Streptomyces xiamenensis]
MTTAPIRPPQTMIIATVIMMMAPVLIADLPSSAGHGHR